MEKTENISSQATQSTGMGRYATLGLGAAVLAGAVTTTDAAVVYTNYSGALYTDTNTADTLATNYSFDVNGDGINDFTLAVRNEGSTSSANYAVILAGLNNNNTTLSPVNIVGTSAQGANALYIYPSRLTTGTISAARTFKTLSLTVNGSYLQAGTFAFGAGFTNSKWKTNATKSGYMGFSFTYGGGLHYGFIGLTVGPQGLGSNSRAISIGGIGYETTANTAITVSGGFGAVPNAVAPEPSSIAMLALGAGGLAAYRQRRRSKKATTPVAE